MPKIGRLNIKWGQQQKEKETLAAKATAAPKQGKVDIYYAPTSKAFSTYKNVSGDTALTYDILEGLYRRTIMKRIIDKPAQDATRLGYTMHVTDMNGKPHEKAEAVCAEITKLIKRRTLKGLYRDQGLYGDAFLYIQKGTNPSGLIDIEQIYLVNPRYMNPDVDANQQLKGWLYASSAKGQVNLTLEEICHIPRNPLTGQLYGNSKMEPVLQVLNLILNSEMNMAVVLDKIAVPMVHWLMDAKHDKRKTPLPEILTFIKNLGLQQVGNDIVTDSSITTEIVGAGDKLIDFSPMIDKLQQTFFATSAVPGQILGMPADNMSAITRQLQTYYEDIFDEQESTSDFLINEVYEPELIKQGITDYNLIYASYAKPMIEQESRIATWVDLMGKDGIIFKKEGRQALGYSGDPPEQPEIVAAAPLGQNQPAFDKKQNQQTPPGVKPGSSKAATKTPATQPTTPTTQPKTPATKK
jgi:hypothetical protein